MKRLNLYVICLSLSVMACSAPVLVTLTPQLSIKNPTIDTSTQPVTQTSTAVMVVCNSGGLNVRPAAGDLSTYSRTLVDGDTVTVKLPAIVAEDMGLWYEVEDGGFINARYVCDVVLH